MYDIMSASEQEQAEPVHSERRMSITSCACDIIIAGAGTAGLSAAIYGVRAGKSVLVLEAKSYGGQIVNSPEVENYPGIAKISGYEFAKNLYDQAVGLGAEYRQERVLRIENRPDAETKNVYARNSGGEEICYEAKAVILATGAKNRPLGVEREQEFVGAGVSYCATCDGMFFRGRDVAVVGGGNTALEDALFLANNCSKVTVIHRRDEFRGETRLVQTLQGKENVEFVLGAVVTELLGEQMLAGVKVRNVKTGEITELAVSGVFVAIGQMPDNEPFAENVKLDEKGYIQASEDCKTETMGIFAAGDCRTKRVRQLTTAASDGAVAALAACEYIG